MAIKSSTDVFNCWLDAWQERFSENGRQIGRKYSSGCMMYREQKAENTKKKAQETHITCVYVLCTYMLHMYTHMCHVYMLFYITCDRRPRREGIGQEWYFLKMIKNMDSRSLQVPTTIKCSKTAENKIKGKNCENS